MSNFYRVKDVVAFGEQLLITGDLDPVYIALYSAKLPKKQLYRLLLAYFCFYHLGASAWLSEYEGEHYWDLMLNAAANEIPPSTDDLPGDRWPRGTERRHFRGKKCVVALEKLAAGNIFGSGTLAREYPEGLIETLIDGYGSGVIPLDALMGRVQAWPMFGPWIAFKAADIFERVVGARVDFPNSILTFYDEPRAALDMLDVPAEKAARQLLTVFARIKAPPRPGRMCNIQEVETICCKWKSSVGGHYWIGKDIHEIRKGLKDWGETAGKLLTCMPREVGVNRGLFT